MKILLRIIVVIFIFVSVSTIAYSQISEKDTIPQVNADNAQLFADDDRFAQGPGDVSTMSLPDFGRYTCSASCHIVCNGSTVGIETGSGSGSSEYEACNAAKSAVNNKVPNGCYKRHCQCRC